MRRKLIALVLAFVMALSLAVVPASANEDEHLQVQEAAAQGSSETKEKTAKTFFEKLLSPVREAVQAEVIEDAEASTLEGSVNPLADQTMWVKIQADNEALSLGEDGVCYATFTVSLYTSGNPIEAVSFNLQPQDGMVLATQTKLKDSSFYYTYNQNQLSADEDPIYNLIAYAPNSTPANYFCMAGYDKTVVGGVAATPVEVMTIMAKFTAAGTYTLDAANIIAGNGDTYELQGKNLPQEFATKTSLPATVKVYESHNMVADSVTTVATAEQDGEMLYKCSLDGCTATESDTFTYANSAVKLTVNTANAYTGSNVSAIFSGKAKIHRGTIYVPVKVETDKTLTAASFTVSCDDTRLTLSGVSEGWSYNGNTVTANGAVPSSATMTVLAFTVKSDATSHQVNPGDASISIASATIRDSSGVLTVGQTSGTVVVTIPGDLNGDGKITGADSILLMKYVVNSNTLVVANSTDTTGDSVVTGADSILLKKYIVNPSTVLY